MATKLAKIVNPKFQETLVKLSKSKIPLKTAYKLKNIIKIANEEFEKYESCRIEALRKWAEKDDNGEMIVDADKKIRIKNEKLEEFSKELTELTNTEIQLDTISIDELGDNCELTAEDLILLEDLIRG